MDFIKWVEKLIEDHKKPVIKYDINKTKLFSQENTREELDLIHQKLKAFYNILNVIRVEKRNERCKLIWMDKTNRAQLTHPVGTKHINMGYQNINGKYLHPEEVLFLLETNRAEIFDNLLSISIHNAYNTIIKSDNALNKYKSYRKLALKGIEIKCEKKLSKYCAERRENPSKKIKLSDNSSRMNVPTFILNTFDRLQKLAPKYNETFIDHAIDYQLKVNDLKDTTNYNLTFMYDEELDPKLGFYEDKDCDIYCNLHDVNTTFLRINSIELPSLI